jgi:competence protein ComEA
MKNVVVAGFLFAFAISAADLPDGPGKPIIERLCTGCHRADAMPEYHKTPEEWDIVVRRMAGRTSGMQTAEVDTLIAYMTKNFPKVEDATKLNINKASAEEIAKVMGLTDEEAKAVVSYRDRHGNYRAWGEMLVIYNVDGKKIAAAKDKITY